MKVVSAMAAFSRARDRAAASCFERTRRRRRARANDQRAGLGLEDLDRPGGLGGKPVVRPMRMPVELVVASIADDWNERLLTAD